MEKIGISEIGMVIPRVVPRGLFPGPRAHAPVTTRQILPGLWLMAG
jgi:hypothetical protein